MITLSRFAIGLLFISSASAFFRLPCAKPVLNARVDPIVSPGQPSSHLHTIQGSGAIGPDATFADLRASNCSTCQVKDDQSAYWAPDLMYQFKNGSFAMVDHGGMIAYYLQRLGSDGVPVKAFPDGFRMLTGDPYVRNYTNTQEAQAISWLCLDYNLPYQPQTPGFTNTNCPNDLRAQIFFPSCWDGTNLDSPDHKSHVAYPSGIDSGDCPPTHPVRLVSLFYELWFYTLPFTNLNDGGRFMLSTGDPTSYSLHGDFMNGWDNQVLQRALDNCTNDSGVIEDCAVFEDEGRFYTDAEMNACSAPDPYPQEAVSVGQVLPYLPGCVAVTEGPGPASPADLVPGCTAIGVGGGGSAASSGVPTSIAPSASNSPSLALPSSSVPTSVAPSASNSPAIALALPSYGVPTSMAPSPSNSSTIALASSGVPTSVAPSPSDSPSLALPSSAIPTSMAPSACNCDCNSPSLVPPSSGVPTSLAPSASNSTTPLPSSLIPTMSPTDSASGSQVNSDSAVLAASQTTSHYHESGGCEEPSASPTSSMAARRRHHVKRGNYF